MAYRLAIILFTAAACPAAQTTAVFKATPASLTFTYTTGDTKLPAAQTISISGSTAFTSVLGGGPWLSITPSAGTTPASVKVLVNPTTLEQGTYAGSVAVTSADATPQTITIAVTLTVKAAPSALTIAPLSLAFTYTRGGAAPAAQTLSFATSGSLLSFTATVAGATWLSLPTKSGFAMLGFPATLTVAVNPAGLLPGSYKGTITVSAPQATTKSQVVNVTLAVSPGVPALNSVWPVRVQQGAPATTITLNGDNFFTGTAITADATTLTSTYVGTNVMTAVLPPSLLATAGTITLAASNSGAGGGDSGGQAFTVLAPGPLIDAIVDGASYQSASAAPGELLVLFGVGLGPDTLAVFAPPGVGGTIASTLGGTRILFDAVPAPVIYTSASQVAVMAPWELTGLSTTQVVAEYNGVQSAAFSLNVVAGAPGVFSLLGGTGQAAAFNVDGVTGAMSLNSESVTAAKGSTMIFYFTGEGSVSPACLTGQLVTSPAPTVNPAVTATIGGQPAQIQYVGGVPGLVSGISQMNVKVPDTVTAGKAIPVVITVSGTSSQAGVTVGIK